jgi:HEAT repeat protein
MNVKPEKENHVDAETKRQTLERILAEKERRRQQAIAINKRDSVPVLADLADAGFQLDWVSDLYSKRFFYKDAVPILLKWLPRMENLAVKEDIVRALSVPWAKPVAAPALVAEFHRMRNESNSAIKWAIANALSVVADDSVFEDIVELVQDSHHGQAREMLAISLGNMKDSRAQDVLIILLDDEEVVGHAIIALGKLKSPKAYPFIERFLTHPKAWVRKEAKKALDRIEKAGKRTLPR